MQTETRISGIINSSVMTLSLAAAYVFCFLKFLGVVTYDWTAATSQAWLYMLVWLPVFMFAVFCVGLLVGAYNSGKESAEKTK